MISGPDRHRVLVEWNATQRPYPSSLSVHALFARRASATPHAAAVLHGGIVTSYAELAALANRLAASLRDAGVLPGDRVAVLLERSAGLIAAQLAILQCGAAYVPLDVESPPARLRAIVDDASCSAAIALRANAVEFGCARVNADDPAPGAARHVVAGEDAVGPLDAAYVMYTSGSTGRPKGVIVPHRAIVRLACNNGFADLGGDDRVAFAANPAFDASTLEVWGALLNGGCVVVVDRATVLAPSRFNAYLLEHGVTVLWLTAGLFAQYARELAPAFGAMRYLIAGGDVLDRAAVSTVLGNERRPAHLLNGYGPTETTTFATTHEIVAVDERSIPIGRPIGNARVYVVDERGEPVAIGALGELWIGGDGVALGYWNRPELDAERFVPSPFVPGDRLYKTGDLCRYRDDGTLEFAGRRDAQIKLRGYRIEPGEIEAALAGHAAIAQACVAPRVDARGRRLVAYYTLRDGCEAPGVEPLRAHLAAMLPEYMVPSAFVVLDALPLTPNGKLDRSALPEPGDDAYAAAAYEAPQGEREAAIAAIWGEVLGLERVGRHDDFFRLGGHSLLAVRAIERMRRAGIFTDAARFFAARTPSELAERCDDGAGAYVVPPNGVVPGCDRLTPEMLPLIELDSEEIERIVATVPGAARNVQDVYPLSPLQAGMLFHHLREAGDDPYLLRSFYRFANRARLDAFVRAVQATIDRHDVLRTSIVWSGLSEPVQVVWRRAPLPVEELARIDLHPRRIELACAPLLRVFTSPAGEGAWDAVLVAHHLICDHATLEALLAEAGAHLAGDPAGLAKPVPFREFVARARIAARAPSSEAFFRSELGDADEPTAPFGVLDVRATERRPQEVVAAIAPSRSARLRARARAMGASLASLVHVAFARVLGASSGREDVVFGTVLLGRSLAGADAAGALGLYINTLPVRVRLEAGVAACVERTHTTLSQLLAHEHASLADAQRAGAVGAGRPLFGALLNFIGPAETAPSNAEAWHGIDLVRFEERTTYPLALTVEDRPEGLRLIAQAYDPIDAARVCAMMEAALDDLVDALVEEPARPAACVAVTSPAERERVLFDYNATDRAYSHEALVHELFEGWAARTPGAAALRFGEATITYAELNARANRLARYLRGTGVGADVRVAICSERAPESIVAILAVLKAGGAYVPLDPSYPKERLADALADAMPVAVLAHGTAASAIAAFAPASCAFLDLERDRARWDELNATNLERGGTAPHHLAYVIYTSGSSGRPKGVAVEHGGLCNLAVEQARSLDIDPSCRVLQFASPAFDAAVLELVLALCHGASLCLTPPARLAAGALEATVEAYGITHALLPPTLLSALPQETRLAGVRVLLTGGEAPTQMIVDRWSPGRRLVNAYGPTEATIFVTLSDCAAGAAPVLGLPIGNVRLYVLDPRGEPLPRGVTGELAIGGAGVARGYLHRDDLTAQRFVESPFVPGDRLYKTGDLVRRHDDGRLAYVGRNDRQVKVRGYRIELGDVEAALLRVPDVTGAVVLAREDVPGEKRLVAYVTGANRDAVAGVREALRAALPEYLVPSAIVALQAFPATRNGKLDRNALPAPEHSAAASYEPPDGEIECALAGLWCELLGCDRVGRLDNFFELGGHSLTLVRAMERLHRLGYEADVATLYAAPTLAALAAALGEPGRRRDRDADPTSAFALPEAERARAIAGVAGGAPNVAGIYPLAPLQDGILFHHLLAEGNDPYVVRTTLRFDGRARLDAFVAALQAVVDRHDALRTSFAWEGLAQPVQIVWKHAALTVSDDASFDLRCAPLVRLSVANGLGGPELTLRFHHIVMDHAALDLMYEEVLAHMRGAQASLAPPVPFSTFVLRARAESTQAGSERFFRAMLAGVDESTAPFGLHDVRGDGSENVPASLALGRDLSHRVRSAARAAGVTAASLFHLAWARVLGAASNRDDVVFGTVLFGRMHGRDGAERVFGLMMNTLPLRVRLGEGSVREALLATHAALAELLEHEHASLALAQRCSQVDARTPLFSALLNYRHIAPGAIERDRRAWRGIETISEDERTNYPLTLSVDDRGVCFDLTVQSHRSVDPARVCAIMHATLEALTAALERSSPASAASLDVLPADERQRVLVEWNASPPAPVHGGSRAHDAFEAQAARTPGALAVVAGGRSLSYGELNARANRLARFLRARGAGPGTRVALCVHRSAETIVALLAVLKAGSGYVPMDPSYPAARLAFVARDADPILAIVGGPTRGAFAGTGVTEIDLDDDEPWREESPADVLPGPAGADDLAYLIYTSGSTGMPKGVAVSHRNVVASTAARFEVYGAYERFALISPVAFDSSVAGIFGTLSWGGSLYLPDDEEIADPSRLCAAIARDGATTLLCVPSLLQAMLDSPAWRGMPSLRTAIVAGETCPPALVERAAAGLPQTQLVNEYGPTEATVWATFRCCTPADAAVARVPIGLPIPGARAYVLDAHGNPAPAGVAGELWIAGPGVTQGYWKRPELTAQRFARSPFVEGERMYRSGDVARHLPDGTLEFLGRTDEQIKLRGYRVEPGEIAAAIARHADVADALVLARDGGAAGRRLVAYCLAERGASIDVAALREHLAASLPEYMIPAAIVTVERWPLTPNGKIDRGALPVPGDGAYAVGSYRAPRDETERAIAEVWRDALGVERVGIHDDFFRLGGHSLVAVHVVERMRRRGLHAVVRAIFTHPTVAELAAYVRAAQPGALPDAWGFDVSSHDAAAVAAAVPGGEPNVQDVYPLAPLQAGILFHHRLESAGDPYLTYNLVRVRDRARLEEFLGALQVVVDRHDVLRTAVLWEGLSEPLQVVWRSATLPVEYVDADPCEGDAANVLRSRLDPRRVRLDVSRAPLLHAACAQDADGSWVLLLRFHHLIADHATLEIALQEARAQWTPGASALPAPAPYRAYVERTRAAERDPRHETFFRALLHDVNEPTLPFGAGDVRGDGTAIVQGQRALPADLERRIRAAARSAGASLASLFHLAWARVLASISGRNDVVFGTVLLGRTGADGRSDGALGLSINTLPARVAIDDRTVADALRHTHAHVAELLDHEAASLQLARRCSGLDPEAPLFAALLNFRHGARGGAFEGDGWDGIELIEARERTNYPLTLSVDDAGDGLALTAQTDPAIDPDRICASMEVALESLTEALANAPETPVRALDAIPAADRHRLLVEWNATQRPYPSSRSLHALFAQRAAATPQAAAVSHGGAVTSYADLAAMASRLAQSLRNVGVVRGDRVAVLLDRSVELIAAQLAILQCGAAYVPLDVESPPARLRAIVDDASCRAVVAMRRDAVELSCTRVDADDPSPVAMPLDTAGEDGVSAGDPAYVMYTSGSTGRPKGVAVPHRAIVRLVCNNGFAAFGADDRLAFAANPAFDASTLEVWGALLNGGCVVVVDRATVLAPQRFNAYLLEQGVTVLWLTAGLFAEYADALAPAFGAMRYLIAGGDVLDRATVTKVLARASRPAHLLNGYGPTETTTFATTYEIVAVDEGSIPIGRPIGNTRIYIVDENGEPVAIGAMGELWIGGDGVALGYWNRPELDAERFVASPFVAGDQLYKTGDVGRYREDGTIEFAGRRDAQIKLRGYRIETGEIEAALAKHARVRDAVVLAREDAGGRRLVAYSTVRDGCAAPDVEELRSHLAAMLPKYMVPSAFVVLEKLPLTPNGKLDRAALPQPGDEAYAAAAYEAPQGERETAIASIWRDVLGVERVGRHDHFFRLGGHSLLVVRVVERMRQERLHVDVRWFFGSPTLAQIAERCEETRAEAIVAPNLIPQGAQTITPEMLSLC